MNNKSIQNRFYPEASDKQGFIHASDKNGWIDQGTGDIVSDGFDWI